MKRQKTQYTGVFYRNRETRKHNGKFDRYFILRYRFQGKQREEGLGWASDGWNAKKASAALGELRRAQVEGKGPVTMAERRKAAQDIKDREKKNSLSFRTIFWKKYFPQAESEKTFKSYDRERSLFEIWIDPEVGDLPLKNITPAHLEELKKRMKDAGRAPRSVLYALAVIRQVFNFAYAHDIFNGDNPVSKVKKPKVDNKRLRFLSRNESDSLLAEIKNRSIQLFNICLLSLHCGCRADEIFSLKWGDVDLNTATLFLWDTKNTETRVVFITKAVGEMLSLLERKGDDELVFTDRNGHKIKQVSNAFNRSVDKLGLNHGIKDRRKRVCFHTLRHTYGSWHAMSGTDLYVLQKLLGHSSFAMVQRYAHLHPQTLQSAQRKFEKELNKT